MALEAAREAYASTSTNTNASDVKGLADSAQSMIDALIASIHLADDGSAVNISLEKVLKMQIDAMTNTRQNINVTPTTIGGDSLVTTELLRRLKASSLSDDDDDINATAEELAKKFDSRARKNRRLIEEKKQYL